jgi:hypothetical protein
LAKGGETETRAIAAVARLGHEAEQDLDSGAPDGPACQAQECAFGKEPRPQPGCDVVRVTIDDRWPIPADGVWRGVDDLLDRAVGVHGAALSWCLRTASGDWLVGDVDDCAVAEFHLRR